MKFFFGDLSFSVDARANISLKLLKIYTVSLTKLAYLLDNIYHITFLFITFFSPCLLLFWHVILFEGVPDTSHPPSDGLNAMRNGYPA
jgi:hypothetical protein